jgi:hypothetical protein
MSLRSAFLAILVASTVLAVITPPASAQEPVVPVCGSAASPAALALGSSILGNDASAATPAASLATGDCFFTVALPGGPEAHVGKEIHLSLASAENHDLFVKRGAAAPLAAPYICTSAATTATSDACRVYWPLTQPTYSIRVSRIAAGAGDFTLSAALVDAPASGCSHGYAIAPLPLNVAQSATVGAAAGSRCYFSFQPASGDDIAKVVGTGLPASLGSYVIAKGGDVPTPTTVPGASLSGDYGCSPPITGTTRTCAGPLVAGETWYAVLIRGTAISTAPTPFGITASSLKACSLGTGLIDVALDVPVTGTVDGSAAAQSCKFRLPVSQTESLSKWSVTPSGANVDLYLRGGAPVATGVFDCGSAATIITTTDVCAVPVEGLSDAYAWVYRPAAGATAGSFTLTVSAVEGCPGLGAGVIELATNVAVAASVADLVNAACRFHYVPSPDDSTVRVTAAPTSGTQTLLVRRGAAPTSTVFDCSAVAAPGSPALCDLENLGDEIFATVKRATGAGDPVVTALGLSPCSLGGGDVELLAGQERQAELTADQGGSCRFKFVVPASSGDAAAFDMTPAGGDFDLYVRKGARPTGTAFDCKSALADLSAESCLNVLDAGTYFAMVQRVSGSGAFGITANAVSSCSLGPAANDLARGVAATGSLLNVTGAKCYFAFTPGNPLADPANPGNDIVKLALSPSAGGNFDLYLRKAAVPTTATRDCQSVMGAGLADACELVVADGSTYYGMVRRASGGGAFTLTATTSSSCGLGPGYHALPNGIEVKSVTRQLAGAKCFFSLPSGPRDDLLSIAQTVDPSPGLTSFTLTVAKDHPASVAPSICGGTSYYFPISGLVLQAAAQCDQLLEDGLAHRWYASVTRTSGTAPDGAAFGIKGSSIIIPTLQPGVPQLGRVDTGTTQYWKVVLPENATFLDIQTAGDVSNLACNVGGQANSLVATACLLLPFPKLVGCAVAAGYGVDCATTQLTLEQRCVAESGDAATCAQVEAARLEACSALNGVQPGACDPAATSGTVNGACGVVNGQTGDATCDPDNASVKTTELDLVVRHRLGLPSTTAHDCRSAGPGAVERCLFSADVKEAHDTTTEPARQDATAQFQDLRAIANGNRTALDQALADLKVAIAENRTGLLEPLWALVRELLFSLTGQDPGPLPATPSVPAAPATPNAAIPDPATALALPGPGKYFIAVRGPLDLASSLYYQGGDYAIVALHDDVQAPTREDVDEQLVNALAVLDQSLVQRCAAEAAIAAVCAVLDGLIGDLCAEVASANGCAHLDGSLSGTCWILGACPDLGDQPTQDVCLLVGTQAGCDHLDGSVEGVCWIIGGYTGNACGLLPAAPTVPLPEGDPLLWIMDSLGL